MNKKKEKRAKEKQKVAQYWIKSENIVQLIHKYGGESRGKAMSINEKRAKQ